jgi:tRNA G18 (ribose-2'-O)-methylase SpoU
VQVLITGAHDLTVPPELGTACARAAREAGDDVEEIIVEGAAHIVFGHEVDGIRPELLERCDTHVLW